MTFTATVSSQVSGTFDNGGTVTFSDGSTSLGTVGLSGATATFSTTATKLSGGTHTITASYSGDTKFSGSNNSMLQTVNTAGTCTSVSSSSNSSVYGQSVTFTATVTVGSGKLGGTVTFSDGSTSLGTASLSGITTFTTTTMQLLSGGTHTITASYSGDTNFSGSSNSVLQTVNAASTTSTLTSDPNPSVSGQAIDFTVTVNVVNPNAGTPTGTATFYDGSTTLGTSAAQRRAGDLP